MEKILNINLQGRVIPIEETAYHSLKQYIDTLRNHFANEESGDEIINDIENRIAELLSYRLKQGAACINNNDLDTVIGSIGRLEDIEAAEDEENNAARSGTGQQPNAFPPKGRFFRNADDKVIAGVCSGIASRTNIDPVVVRIVFVLLFGALFWIYLLLWIVVPSQSISANVTRRLYRNPDDKMIAGVCSGLAVYFRMPVWIMRLIFVLPFFIGMLSFGMHTLWWHWHWGVGHRLFTGSFGSTLFIMYIILWIAVPFASSATDRMEMRGEKIDLNSIKAASQAKGSMAPPSRSRRNGAGHAIGMLFKAFFLFIAGVFALSFFGVLIGLVFSGFVAMPFTSFILDGWGQGVLACTGIILFTGIPFLALVTWIIRRLIGVRSHRHYLGYVFAGLWLIGLVSILMLAGQFMRNFSSKSMIEESVSLQQPSVNTLYINVSNNGPESYNRHSRWFNDWDNDDAPFRIVNKDSLWLNTVKVKIGRSADSQYHIYETKISRGETSQDAKNLASHISFNLLQQDSMVTLPGGFTISNKDKFRNQQVMIIVEVPDGKEIQLGRDINTYNWFTVDINRRRNFYIEHNWEKKYYHRSSGKYKMTESGLERTSYDTHKNYWDNDDDDD